MRQNQQEILRTLGVYYGKKGEVLGRIRFDYYRRKYKDIIDEVWLTAFMRISEVYGFADKVKRVGTYNELANVMNHQILGTLALNPSAVFDEPVQKALISS